MEFLNSTNLVFEDGSEILQKIGPSAVLDSRTLSQHPSSAHEEDFFEKSPLQIRERGQSTPCTGVWARSEFHYRRGISESLRDIARCHSGVENKQLKVSVRRSSPKVILTPRGEATRRLDSCQGQFGDFIDIELYLTV